MKHGKAVGCLVGRMTTSKDNRLDSVLLSSRRQHNGYVDFNWSALMDNLHVPKGCLTCWSRCRPCPPTCQHHHNHHQNLVGFDVVSEMNLNRAKVASLDWNIYKGFCWYLGCKWKDGPGLYSGLPLEGKWTLMYFGNQ